ncbi:DUF523 domain-containing protein [Desulfotalea psychrophila]|nr:DUF523 domain-containing protein [Desulfotalea psychrophila]
MKEILVSACLLGQKVRYNGGSLAMDNETMDRWLEEGRVVAVCPEVISGMSTPRNPSEILGGDGVAVLGGRARVQENTGQDVSSYFIAGAEAALSLCLQRDIRIAILAESSPSCGSSSIYDGSFSALKKTGMGVTAALLRANGIEVFSQLQIAAASKSLLG